MADWLRLRALLSVVWVFLVGMGPTVAQEVAITPRLRVGDEFRLEVTRVRTNSSRPQEDGKSTTPIDVRVVAATADSITLDWTPGTTTFENAQVAENPLLVAASNAVTGMVLRITLDADGRFTGLANGAEVASKLQAAVKVITTALEAKLPVDRRHDFQAFIGQVLSPSVLINSATREVQMYFGLNGTALSVGETDEFTIEQPNPLGGGVIPSAITVRAESASSDVAVLITTTTYDRESLRRLTLALIEQTGRPVPPQELTRLPPLEMSDDGRYVLDRTVGLMREVILNRRVAAGTNGRRDSWEIRLARGPQR
ncbi:MAG: hypothetical protein ACRD3C_13390 [Vicinamibacterales bacterium]